MNKKNIVILSIIFTGFFFWYFFLSARNIQNFMTAYRAYGNVSVAEEISARVPGVGENISRQKLNLILSRVLTENLTPEERQKLSEEGLVFVRKLRAEIDVIGAEGKKTEMSLQALRESLKKVGGFFVRRKAENIVALGESRRQTIKDIEGVLYEINDKLENIFQGIILDHGVLTPQRIRILNVGLPEAEKQFNQLTENYKKLDSLEKEINSASAAL